MVPIDGRKHECRGSIAFRSIEMKQKKYPCHVAKFEVYALESQSQLHPFIL